MAETIYVKRVTKGGEAEYVPVGEKSIPVTGQTNFSVTLHIGQLDYGTGVSLDVRADVETDGTPEGRAKAFDALLEEARQNIKRNESALQEMQVAAYAPKGTGAQWNPSGIGTNTKPPAAPPGLPTAASVVVPPKASLPSGLKLPPSVKLPVK
jgi:hypothetical protein